MSGKLKSFLKSLTLSAAVAIAGAEAQAKPAYQNSFSATTAQLNMSPQSRTYQIQQLANTYMQHALKFEKCFLTPYICPTGNITIGVGINVNSMKEFCKLELRNSRLQLLNMDQKKSYYYSLAAYRKRVTKYGQCALAAEKQKKFSCRITPAYAQRLYLAKSQKLITELDQKMAKAGIDFMKMPRHVQLAVIDMQYTLGNSAFTPQKWPRFFRALKTGNYLMASRESSVKNVQSERNQWRQNLLMRAHYEKSALLANLFKKRSHQQG